MNIKISRFMRSIFSLRNIPPIIIVLGALIGSLGIVPPSWNVSSQQLVLALLAFLAVDSLVERLDILSKIENNTLEIRNMMNYRTTAKNFFKTRRNFPRMEELIEQAKQELWISGVSLDSLIAWRGYIISQLEQGIKVKILGFYVLEGYDLAIRYYNWHDLDSRRNRTESNLRTILSVVPNHLRSNLEVRVLNTILSNGYFVIDPNSSQGRMTVQLYLYHSNIDRAPMFELNANDDTEWFTYFREQFVEQWNHATDFAELVRLN